MFSGGMLGILDSLTGGEVLIILLAALLIIGPERLPETARTLGQWMSKLRSMTTNLQSEVREVLDDPAMKPIRDVGEFVAAPRKKLVEFATAAEAEAEEAKRVADAAADAAAKAESAAAEARAAATEAEVLAADAAAAADAVDALVEQADHADDHGHAEHAEQAEHADDHVAPARERSIWADLTDEGAADPS